MSFEEVDRPVKMLLGANAAADTTSEIANTMQRILKMCTSRHRRLQVFDLVCGETTPSRDASSDF